QSLRDFSGGVAGPERETCDSADFNGRSAQFFSHHFGPETIHANAGEFEFQGFRANSPHLVPSRFRLENSVVDQAREGPVEIHLGVEKTTVAHGEKGEIRFGAGSVDPVKMRTFRA